MENLKFHEVEVKFRVDEKILNDWKLLVEKIEGLKQHIYTESDDVYYVKGDEFLRYRASNREKRAELTYKLKTKNGNNIVRQEVNLRVDNNESDLVEKFTNLLGFQKNFIIKKFVQIYKFDDATLPFYTVIDENGKRDTFIEIEVNESKMENLTEDECWNIIRKYEELLAPLGITPQKRLKLSLFEMYKK